MKNKSSMSRAERLRREKVTRYSIRKYSFGAASVAVAALFMFLGNGAVSVQADEIQAPQVVGSIDAQSEKETDKPVAAEENATYAAPAVELAPAAVAGEKVEKPVETTQNSKEEPVVATEKAKEADGVQLPSLTVVADSSALTDEEKANIVEAVKGVNPTATDVQVQADGSVVVTFTDGSTANLSAAQTVKVAAQAETSATQPKSRSRRAAGQERAQDRSAEGKDIKYVYQNRQATVNGGEPTQRAKIEYRQLDDYEVVNGKTVATDPSGQGRPVLEWTVTFNEAKHDWMGGYYYFTIPNNVSDPYNVVTDYDGAYVDRDGWKDANKESGAGSANAEGVQYIDAGNKLEWRVKNTVGRDYNNVDGLSGVMGDSKKVYVLQLYNGTSARKITIKYRTVVEDTSKVISYLAGVESKTNHPKQNWYAISGKYDKNLVSQVATPSVTPNLTNTSVNVPVQTVDSTSSTLSGTGVPGATIKLYIDGKEQNIGNVTVDNSGNWTTGELPTALNNNQGDGTTIKPRQTVEVSQVVNGEESSRRTVPVSVGMTTVEPSSLTTNQDAVVAGQKEVTLKVPHDAGIAYMRYTNTAGQTVEIPVKRDNASSAWTSQKPEAATVKSVENGKFQDTIVLTMADKIAGTEVSAISNVVEGGFSSVAGWQPRGVENQAPTIASAVEGNRKTVAQGAQLDLASLVTVADKEDDKQATLGDKVHAEVVSVNGDTTTKTVDTNTPGTYTVKYKAVDSQGLESNEVEVTVVVNPARQNEAPTVEIPYSDPATKDVYVYANEDFEIPVKFTDDSGKIASATIKRGGNQDSPAKDPSNPDVLDNQYNTTVEKISTETVATAEKPAIVKIKGNISKDNSGIAANLFPQTADKELKIVTRYATATDTDGAFIKNGATDDSYAKDPGSFTIKLKAQTAKYDIKNPETKIPVDDANNISEDVFNQIRDSIKIQYSTTNKDKNLADKQGKDVENQTERIESITREGNNVVVTYKDGSTDTKPLSDFVTQKPATPAKPSTPVVDTDLTGKAGTKDPVEVTAAPGSTVALYDKDGNKIGEGVADENGKATITPTVDIPAGPVTAKATKDGQTSDASAPKEATAATPAKPSTPVVDTDLTGKAGTKDPVEVTAAPGSTVALYDKDGNKIGEGVADENGKATITPTVDIPAGPVTAKATKDGQTSDASAPKEATAATPAKPSTPVVDTDLTGKAGTKDPVEVTAAPGSTVALYDKDGNKIGEGVADENGKATITPTVDIPAGPVTAKATKDGQTSDASAPKEATAATPAKPSTPVVDTDLTGKAGTKDPVEVTAAPGSTVALYDKDGNKIGEGVADENGKATITPTVDIPAGPVTAKATKDGQTSDASAPKEATAATPAKPSTPVVDTDLTGKAGTKDPVEVTAAPGSTVALYDKDGNKIGEGVADENGKATITPTVDIPAGPVTAKATKDGQTSDASAPKEATAATPAKPSTPVVDTDLTGKAGTKDPVEVTAAPGSTVALYDKDGNKIGEGVADENGKATITPTVDIPAGPVTAKATKDGQTSDASAPKEATAATPAKPSTPVVDTDLTGKAGTKDPVEVTAAPGSTVALYDKDGNKIGEGVADENGKATITPTVDIPAGPVTAKATKDGQTSDASAPKEATAATPAKPSTPVVDTDLTGKAGTKDPVEVTAAPGSTVALYDKDGNKIGEGVADENGKATITPTVDIPAGPVTAKATKDGQTSDASAPKEATAATPAKPSTPVVDTDLTGKAGTKDPVEVTAAPGSTVALYDKDGNKIGEGVADENGKATITPTVDIPAGPVTAKATKDGQTSDASAPKEATAATPAKPSTPVVDTDLTGKAGTKDPVEVTAAPGSTVALYDKDGNKIGEGVADENGKATITPTVDIPAGPVTAKATKDGQTSDASAPKEATAATPAKPSTPVVDTDLTGKAGTKDPVEVTAAPGSTVALYDKDGNKIGEGVADENGKATITPTVDIPAGPVTAKATKDGQTSDASAPKEATAATPAKPSTPVVDTDLTGKAGTKDPVEVTAAPGSTVALYDKDGNKIGEGVADENGKATITPTVDIPAGPVTAKATKDGQTSEASAPKVATAATPTTPTQPEITTDLTGKAGTKTPVEVTAEPGSKVEMYDKDGNKIGEGTADENGKATITPTIDIPEGNVTVVATKDGQTPEASDPVPATAAKDPETPAKPSKPVVDTDLTGKAGTKTPVEVTAEPGTKVELFDKDGNKIGEAATGANGKAIITPTVDIPEGNVTAKATKDGQTSEASAPKVATAATPTTPTQPEITTDLTGKAGTKTPVEVTAEPGSKVEMYDKDGNKIGEATADENGKATITPTVDIPEGNVTVVATKDGQTPEASDPVPATTAKDPATPAKDAEGVKDPEVKTPVKDPANLTDAEKAKVAEEVKKANPTAKDVEVGKDGTTTVTFPDGSTAEIPAAKTVEKAKDAEGVKDPEAKTPVKDPDNLTDAEKAKVAEEVKKANPTAKDVEVGKDGTTTVTFPDGSKAEIPAAKTVEKAKDAEGVKDPEAKTPVKDPANLTDAEKAKVADEVKKANPTAKDVEVGKDGTATVTFPDGSKAEIPAAKTVEKAKDAEGVKDPEAKTPVKDPDNLTDAEKAKVADEVKKANPTAKDVEVGKDGTTTVTFPDGSKAEIPAAKTVEKAKDAEGVKDPEAKTPVKDPANLTDAEKAKVADEVKKANPTAKDVEVGKDGTTTVTFPDGSTAEIPAAKTVEKAKDAEGVKDPEVKTPVKDPANLTDAEKAKVADEVKKANPTAKDVEVGKDGTTTVTFPDGSTAEIPAAKAVEKAKDAEGVKDPEAKTPVKDPANLTDAEKAKVAEEVKKANPTAKDVEVGKDGTTTVTFPDGSTAEIPAAKAVEKAKDAEGVKDPEAKTPVKDPANLTDAEKAKVAEEVKKANPTAKDVEVGKDGTATVTFPDGSTAVIPSGDTVKKSSDNAVKDPAVTPVTDPSNLTDAEKAKVADEVKKANPTAKDVEVGKDGTATVTFPDGSTAVIPSGDTVKKSSDNAVKDPAVTPVTDPSNLTDAEKAKVADEVKKSNPTVTDVKVGKDGTATVTFPDGSTAVIPSGDTVKKSSDNAVKDPAVTPVTDPSNLTEAEKAKVADEVKKANPTAKDVEVGKDGTATVTFPDGSTAVIPSGDTVKKSSDNAVKDPAVTPVTDPSNLTEAEKAKVADEVKKANPTVTDVKVGKDGTATVTFPDGSTAVIPSGDTVKKSSDNAVKDPAVTPVTDPSNLTDAEKAKVADEVKKANPTAKDVEVGKDGTATVTFPDGSTAVIPSGDTVKKSSDNAVKDPAVTPVTDPSNLTDAEKAKVADEVKKANPTVTDVKVGKDGTATVTFPDGSTAVIPSGDTVKKSSDNAVKDPAVTPVTDPSNLTEAEKAKVADEVKKANPTAKDVEVGKDGTATVTFPDGSTAVIPSGDTVKKSSDNAVKDPAVTPVTDPSNLTEAEKAKVADEVKKANPTAKDVEVGKDGTATVTFPDGSTAVIPSGDTVKKSSDNAVKDPAVTPVTDPSNLTDAEKAKVADEVKKSNPTVTDVKVGKDGTATVTFPDGSTAVIPSGDTVKKSSDNAVKDPAVTPVTDPSNLTDAEKAKVADEVKKANPTAKDVEVGKDGTATVTFPDGSTAVIPSGDTVKKSSDNAVKDPAVTPVTDPSNLTDAEKAKVADEVKKANPTVTDVKVGKDGTATVTFPDGSTAVIPSGDTVKKSSDNAVKDPAVTPVTDPSNLTDAEKGKVAEEVKKSNPSVTDVKVGKDGKTTVTYPDGTTAIIPADKTVKKSDDKVVKDPSVTPVTDPSNLTDAEKAKVADEVKKANPTATDVKVNKDGSVVVTFKDGTVAVIPADKIVKKSADKVKESDGVKNPTVTPITDPSNLTDAEKAKVADEVKKANPTAKDIKVNKDGSVVVTFEDGSTAVIPADKTVKKSADKEVKDPSVTPVTDPSNLTDAEKAKIAEEVKKSNPTAKDIKVNKDGSVIVTFEDGTTAVIPADKTVKKSDGSVADNPATNQDSSAKAPAKKAGAKELPNTGTEQSSASLALALLAAATGGLLFAKKREEEE